MGHEFPSFVKETPLPRCFCAKFDWLRSFLQAYMDGALTAWNTSALAIIRRALEVKGLVVDDTLRGSLLSSISSPEPSPLSACDRGDILTVDSSGQPVLRPTCNAGRRESESSMRDGESLGEGIGESIEREIAVKPCRSVEILSPNRSGQNEEWGRARVDVGGVANDARDDGQCDEEKGQGEGEKEAGGFMEALLQTSEKLEAAVERQQKVPRRRGGGGWIHMVLLGRDGKVGLGVVL